MQVFVVPCLATLKVKTAALTQFLSSLQSKSPGIANKSSVKLRMNLWINYSHLIRIARNRAVVMCSNPDFMHRNRN